MKRQINLAVLFLVVLVVASCATMTPKKQLTMTYGIYNSQYTQYMTATGYMIDDDGTWLKVDTPNLTEEQRVILRQKKRILTQMYPLIKLYDAMVKGTTAFSSATEQELLNLIDQLAALGGVK